MWRKCHIYRMAYIPYCRHRRYSIGHQPLTTMEQKRYYYSDGKEKYGPFTLDDLKEKKLTRETLIWFDGELFWHPLTALPSILRELSPYLKESAIQKESVPPPLPNSKVPTANKATGKNLGMIPAVIWTSIHLFALLMSYTGIDFFNTNAAHKDSFWPFVKFTWENEDMWGRKSDKFRGIFYQYDWTEFALYVGVAWLIYLIIRLTSPKRQSPIQ